MKQTIHSKRTLGCLLLACSMVFSFVTTSAQVGGAGETYSVSTAQQKRGVLLEEFTGIHCGYCPQGHAVGHTLMRATDLITVVAVHAGYFAVPQMDEPDFRIEEGEALNTYFGVSSYPSGLVNRQWFTDYDTYVTGRSSWTAETKRLSAEDAPLNLLATATYHHDTRLVDVRVEGYFTASIQSDSLALNVLWTQNNIIGPQNGGNMGEEYVHQHMLRGFVSPLWGDALPVNPAAGTYFAKNYSFTLPSQLNEADVKPEDVRIVAFVTDGKGDVQQVTKCLPACEGYNAPLSALLGEPKISIGTYYGFQFFDVELQSTTTDTIRTATFDITVNGTSHTAEWNGCLPPMETQTLRLPCSYDVVDNALNSWRISLQSLNGQAASCEPLQGDFSAPIAATPQIKLTLKTNKEASDNHFRILDAEGNVVKEFGPFADGEVTNLTEDYTLEPNKVYCFEAADDWGNGIYSPAGYYTLRSSDGSVIQQVYELPAFGVRSFFTTTKTAEAIREVLTAEGLAEVFDLNGRSLGTMRPARSALPAGIYLLRDVQTGHTTKYIVK